MAKTNFYDQISKNKRNSILLASLVFALLVALIYVIGLVFFPEFSLLIFASSIVFVGIYIFGTYTYGDQVVLSSMNAKLVEEGDKRFQRLNDVVDGLSIAAGMPRPKVYVMESDEMNAFATGKDPQHSSIAVTTALLENMKKDELEGVIGHELSHVKNYDIRFATIVAVMVGLIAIISYIFMRSLRYGGGGRRDDKNGAGILILVGIILAIFAPIAVRLVQAAISRKRELLADSSSAELTRYPEGLASALEKIKSHNQGKMNVSEAMSHLFFADPTKSPLDDIFATHPPIEQRIKLLRDM
jgi:heat shock protein HtpX